MEELAIIILNYNDFEETQRCVDNLVKIGVKSKIVIVDNMSSNNSYCILKDRYKDVDYIDVIKSEKNGGYSYGNNFGIKYVTNKDPKIAFLAIMNPDVRIKYKSLLNNIVKKLKDNKDIAAMSPLMISNGYLNYENICWDLPDERTIYTNYIIFKKRRKRRRKIVIDNDFIAKVDVIPGSFFIIKREELEKINFLDENTFLYNEENILSKKLLTIGKSVALSMNDYYEHNHIKPSRKPNLKKRLEINKISLDSRKYLCKMYYSKKSLIKLEIINIFNVLFLVLAATKERIRRIINKSS